MRFWLALFLLSAACQRPPHASLTTLPANDTAAVRTAFNAAASETRLLVLLSPT